MAKKNDDKSPADELAEKLFPYKGDEFADSVLSLPPEQRRLHTETYDFAIATIAQQMEEKRIFVPEFQRNYVWTLSQASRLIESLIIQCPIPVIYLNQEVDERMSVIDGNQRLTSIWHYLQNRFELVGLTAYPELSGKRFFDLDPRFQRHITNRTLRCIVIMKDTHPQVKFDVFERLNTGATKLTTQELRHGLYHGPLMEAIESLSHHKIFSKMVDIRQNKRMRVEELVLRFLALNESLNVYEKPLSVFLNTFARENQRQSPERLQKLAKAFEEAVERVHTVFGEYAFKIYDSDFKVHSTFNAALFDAEMVGASFLTNAEAKKLHANSKTLLKDFAEMLLSEEFSRYFSRATSDETSIQGRIAMVRSFLSNHLS